MKVIVKSASLCSFLLVPLMALGEDHKIPSYQNTAYKKALTLLNLGCSESLMGVPHSLIKDYTYSRYGELESDTSPFLGPSISSKREHSIQSYYKLTQENASEVFAYYKDFDNGDRVYYAKAVVVSMLGAEPTIYFFPIGEGTESFNVHHRDAMVKALKTEKSRMEVTLNSNLDALNDDLPAELEAILESNYDAFSDFFDLVLAGDIAEIIERRAPLTDSVELSRVGPVLERSQGYQLQAKRTNRGFEIIGFDIDSGITNKQIDAEVYMSHRYQLWLLAKTLLRIDKSLQNFKISGFPAGMNWLENYPHSPDGSSYSVRGGAYMEPRILWEPQ